MPEADTWDVEAFHKYITTEVLLPTKDSHQLGKVTNCKQDIHGNLIGCANQNPILNTRIYEVTFPIGLPAEYTANIIAECLYSQIDNEDRQFLLLDNIIDWKKTKESVNDHDIFQISHNENIHKLHTTKGWNLCVFWKDGSTSWE